MKSTPTRWLSALVSVLACAPAASAVTDAPTAVLSIAPATITAKPGSTVTVAARVSLFDDSANAVAVRLEYPPSKLTYIGSAINRSVWNITAAQSARGGTVDIEVAAATPVTGEQLVATITFAVRAAGPISLSIGDTSMVASATTNADLLGDAQGAATAPAGFTLTVPLRNRGGNLVLTVHAGPDGKTCAELEPPWGGVSALCARQETRAAAIDVSRGHFRNPRAPHQSIDVLKGPVGANVQTLELLYRDRSRTRLPIDHHWVLYQLDSSSGAKHVPLELIARDRSGRVLASRYLRGGA